MPVPELVAVAMQPAVAYYARVMEADGRRATEERRASGSRRAARDARPRRSAPRRGHAGARCAERRDARDSRHGAGAERVRGPPEHVQAHRCAAPAHELFPRYPAKLPRFLDPEWLEPLRAATRSRAPPRRLTARRAARIHASDATAEVVPSPRSPILCGVGQQVAARTFSREDRQRYRRKVRACLEVLARMLAEARFHPERRSFGMEIEFNLTDEAGDPALRQRSRARGHRAIRPSRPSWRSSTSRSTSLRGCSRGRCSRSWRPRPAPASTTPRSARGPRARG